MFVMPWPPTVNNYWRNVGGQVLISKRGRTYRKLGIIAAKQCNSRKLWPYRGRLAIELIASPPDRRRRDLDNLLKALLDVIQHAGVYLDDSQLDDIHISRQDPVRGGQVIVSVTELEEVKRKQVEQPSILDAVLERLT